MRFTIVHYQTDFEKLFATFLNKTKASSNPADGLNTLEGKQLCDAGGATISYLFQNSIPLTAHTILLLYIIIGENPVSNKNAGNTPNLAHAWYNWAKENGYC